MSSISEKIKIFIKTRFARNKKNNKNRTPEIQVNTGPQVSTSGYNVGESVSPETITESLLEALRNETETGNQIEIIANRDPDVSMAVWAFQRLAFQGFNIEITDLNGNRLTDVEQLFETECKNWNTLSSDGLDGIVDNLHKVGLLYNIMMIEAAVSQDSENTFDGIFIIDPRDIEWTLEERDGKQRWIPYQDQNGTKVDLTTGNVYWAIANPDLQTPVGSYLLEPAIAAVDYKLQTMSDSSAVLRHNGYPVNVWSINKERVVNSLTPSEQTRPDKVRAAIQNAIELARTAASGREPTQDIIVTDDIEVGKNANSTAGSSIDVRAWMESVDIQIMNGVKSLGILLNRSQGDTETWGSVQMKVITDMVESFQNKTKRLIEQVGALWLQLNGVQGYFKMEHKPLDYQSEIQKWQALNGRVDHYIKAQNQRWIDANTAAKLALDVEGAVKDIYENSNIVGVTVSGKEITEKTDEQNNNVNNNVNNQNEQNNQENSGGEQQNNDEQ